MPTISRFFGILILMYHGDHVPPHFHIRYAEYRARMSIETLELMDGYLPRRVHALVLEWSALYRRELQNNWRLAQEGQPLEQIPPLE